jgi:methylmalonyl-CoA/ethylmalonyl-CoA epimerase
MNDQTSILQDQDLILDHIAIAVKQLDQTQEKLKNLGLNFNHPIEQVESQKVSVSFTQVDQTAKIELLEPSDESSVIQKYLDKKGDGVHHLAFKVVGKTLEEKQKQLEAKGFQFVYKTPQPGAGGMKVNFIHPKTMAGLLIEILEKNSPGASIVSRKFSNSTDF